MSFFNSYFSDIQITLLMLGSVFFLLSIIMHLKNKERLLIVFLGLTAVCIFSFSALLDPFLNLWDERFHALVGKNLMSHPLMPTLYDDPIVNTSYDGWDKSHIWLHKQPLFLWQIALSFKIFGVSEFSLRIPSIILCTILVLITYRSGKLLVNRQVGYVSALLMISTIYLLELIAGRQELEHNDIAFLTYTSLSIWSLIEYRYSNKKVWIYLIGLFSGMAVLCKWLVGLLVYFAWFVLRITQKKFKFSENKDILISLFITILIFMPWQILTFLWYPAEAMSAFKYNSLHFTVAIEGHGGDFWYHFDMINKIYGKLASLLIIPAFAVFYKNGNDKKLIGSLFATAIVVYLFFSLAATKMPSFTIIVSMIVFIAFASLFDYIINYINRYVKNSNIRNLVFSVSVIAVVLLRFDVEFLQEKHTLWKDNNQCTRMLAHNKEVFKSLDLPPNTVLFNVKGRHYIEAMFYTGLPAYNFVPSFEQYQDLKNQKRNIAIFTGNNIEIPDYLINDTTTIFINKEIKGYD